MITKLEQNGKKVHLECTNKNDIKKLQNQWKKLGLTLIRDTKLIVEETILLITKYYKEDIYYAITNNRSINIKPLR